MTEDFERSATGTFLRSAKSFAAELERERIAERTDRGKRARVDSGLPLVGKKAPYGYVWSDPAKKKGGKRRLALDPDTAPVVRRIFDLALAGNSLRSIAAALAADAIPSPDGKPTWSITTIRRILLNPVATGTAVAWRQNTNAGRPVNAATTSGRRPPTSKSPCRTSRRQS